MRRFIISLFLISIFLLLAGCSTADGLVWKGQQPPVVPPPEGNPGGAAYQLQCTIDLSKTTGHAPMPVNMYANVIGGMAPFYYRWNVDGDAWWDYGGPDVPEVGINYASAGIYEITLEVEDAQGQAYRATALVDVKPSGPAAHPAVFPSVGYAPLTVSLDGSASYDLDGYIVLYEWDYESTGVWDYSSEDDPTVTINYPNPGTYNATLRVTDDDGLTDEASMQIVVL